MTDPIKHTNSYKFGQWLSTTAGALFGSIVVIILVVLAWMIGTAWLNQSWGVG